MATSAGRRVDPSRFAMVPRPDVQRSAFDVSHSHKTTFNAGELIPVYVDEVLPGDSHKVDMTGFARLATTVVPPMDSLIMESFFFFVPARLLWSNWRRFMGERNTPTDTTVFLVPQVTGIGNAQASYNSIYNYFGIHNQNSGNSLAVNALPFRAYNLIWNEWFRDQDLQPPVTVDLTDGPDGTGLYTILRRGKRHDYFTSARPWPQKPLNVQDSGATGGPLLPGGRMTFPQAGAPVTGIGFNTALNPPLQGAPRNESGGRPNVVWQREQVTTGASAVYIKGADSGAAFPDVRVLINDIRTANAVQLLLERNARGGTRYTELIRSHFGVVSPDGRLQRPEYLGGGRSFVTINPVVQQSASGATGTTTLLGELAGVGTVLAQKHGFSQSFTEHGYIIGLVCVRGELTYQQGIERMWHRRTQFDFFWPSLQNLGEQAILRKEIYADGTAGDDNVFGYQERWAEYKYKPSRVSGRLRSRDAQTLDVWHFAQLFNVAPSLGATFIEENPPVDRVAQVDTFNEHAFIFDGLFNARKVRPMSMFSIPGLGPRL